MKNDLTLDLISTIVADFPAALDAAGRNLNVVTMICGAVIVYGILEVLRIWGAPRWWSSTRCQQASDMHGALIPS